MANPGRHNELQSESLDRLRVETFAAYGGACQCCGEPERKFLSIDHINGGGNAERRRIGRPGGVVFYRWLRKNGYPPGYQTLCHNCNLAKGFFGTCPHQVNRRPDIPTSE